MLITAIQIRRLENTQSRLLGIAAVTLDQMIVIHDIRILKGSDSLFLAMPSRQIKPKTFRDVVHPINSDARQTFERLIFAAYEEALSNDYRQLDLTLKEGVSVDCFYDLSYADYDVVPRPDLVTGLLE